MSNPFERLRAIIHWGGTDDADLAVQAASVLASMAREPAGLVVACRRMLAHHPANGVLWWVCARVLAAAAAPVPPPAVFPEPLLAGSLLPGEVARRQDRQGDGPDHEHPEGTPGKAATTARLPSRASSSSTRWGHSTWQG